MNRIRLPGMTAAALLSFVQLGVAGIDDETANAMLNSSGCNACHALERKIIGPAYRDIASKYKEVPEAVAMLFERVRDGSSGVWGPIPMLAVPPDRVGDKDLGLMLEWILGR
jgi:cytochrome c